MWSTVLTELERLYPSHACAEYLRCYPLFSFKADEVGGAHRWLPSVLVYYLFSSRRSCCCSPHHCSLRHTRVAGRFSQFNHEGIMHAHSIGTRIGHTSTARATHAGHVFAAACCDLRLDLPLQVALLHVK